MTEYMQKK